MTKVSISVSCGSHRRPTWGRKDEEYIADFVMVSRRYLDEDERRVFRLHYLLGADWRLCCRKLNMDRGNFFHYVYRIQQKLGRVYRELEPFSLYPLDEYFQGTMRINPEQLRSTQSPVPIRPRGSLPLVAPLKIAA